MSKIALYSIETSGRKADPPAAVIHGVTVVGKDPKTKILAVIDTAAERSTVPCKIMRQLEIKPEKSGILVLGFDSRGRQQLSGFNAYSLSIMFCDKPLLLERAKGGHEDFMRLGRDILSRGKLTISWLAGGEKDSEIKL